MEIIENPSIEALQKLQEILEKERPGGIVDIWVCIKPYYLAVEHAGSIIGVASISLGCVEAEIYKIYVSPSYRRQGVARRLFDEALLRFRQYGIKEVLVETASQAGRQWFQSVTLDQRVECMCDDKYSFQLVCK